MLAEYVDIALYYYFCVLTNLSA